MESTLTMKSTRSWQMSIGPAGNGTRLSVTATHSASMLRVDHGIAQRAAGGRTERTCQIARIVGGRRCDEGGIDGEPPGFDGQGAPPVGLHHEWRRQQPLRDRVGYWAGDIGADNPGHHPVADVLDQRGVHRKDRTRRYGKTPQSPASGSVEHLIENRVPVAQMVMERDYRPIAKLTGVEGSVEATEHFALFDTVDVTPACRKLNEFRNSRRTLEARHWAVAVDGLHKFRRAD